VCGRFTLKSPPDDLASAFGLDEVPELETRYNIAPTQDVAVVRRDPRHEGRTLAMLRWGLIPPWAKNPSVGNRLINARAESAADRPSFREAFRFRRALVVADGFYEWKRVGARKQPIHIGLRDRRPFGFAGLWERWRAPDGGTVESCTILTTEPNDLVRPIHDRMPVILPARHHDLWLDPEVVDAGGLVPLLGPYPAGEMTAHPVATLVNSPDNEGPDLIDPVPPLEEAPRLF
jgi:putative SOS response-associated peptidase YedK